MPESENQYPEGVEPLKEVNPEDVELSRLAFMGQPVNLVREDGTPLTDDEVLEVMANIVAEAEAAPDIELEALEGAPVPSPMDAGLMPGVPPEDPMTDVDAGMIVPQDAPDPGGHPLFDDPPMVDGLKVYEMPSTLNGADAFWKLRDFASDGVSLAALDLKQCIEEEAFGTEEDPLLPPHTGDFCVAGRDSNDKLYIVLVVVVSGDQTDLESLRAAIGAFAVDDSYFGLTTNSEDTYLVIPLYNEGAGGCGDACADSDLPYELHLRGGLTSGDEFLEDYLFDTGDGDVGWGGTTGATTRNKAWNIVTDSSGLSLGTCGLTIRMMEYVSVGACMHRLLTFDNCGKLTSVSAAHETTMVP